MVQVAITGSRLLSPEEEMPLEIAKRDGSIVPFDRRKIETAIEKCFAAIGVDAEASAIADMVERAVDKYTTPSVEQVQNVVETVLCAVGLRHAARAYMTYRDERAQLRNARKVDDATRAAFDESAEILGNDPIRMFQLLDKYARHANGRRETWPECVARGVDFLREIVVNNCGGDRLTDGEWAEIRDAVTAMDALPSMRLLSQAGASARRDNVAIYNCFAGGETFLTPHGPAVLRDHVGESVVVRSVDGEWRTARVESFGRQSVYRVKLRHWNGGKAGNFIHEVYPTKDHRWLLADGTETTDLKVGDKLASPDVAIDPSPEGWIHGFVFGDGTIAYGKEGENGSRVGYCQIRLCGAKRAHLDRFAGFAHSYPPSFNGDPVVYLGRDRIYLKSLPTLDASPSYVAGFLDGLRAADGSVTSCGNWTIHTQDAAAAEWIKTHAPLAGFKILSERVYTEPTNFGPRAAPLRSLLIGKASNAYLRVESMEYIEETDVFCVVEPVTRTFTLGNGQITGNCAYQAFDDLSCVYESLHIAMAGCGDAYSVEGKFIRKLPFVRYQREGAKPDLFVVPDTSEGWVAALRFGVERWFDGHDAEYDFSNLRAAGTVLRTKGGQASGPGPLRYVLDGVRRVILSRQGGSVRPIDGNDIMCITGEAGNSGGQRRTAKLSLSDWGDTEMRDAKGPDFFAATPWRSNANNSAAWPDEGPSMVDLLDQMTTMFKHKSGERGIFSRSAALRTMPAERAAFLVARGAADSIGTNPCGEIVLQSRQFCNLSQAVARPGDDVAALRRKVRIATILGTIQSLATHFPHLRPEWAENCRSERLLGVDITGQMDCPAVRDAGVLRELRDVARATNAVFAARFGIRPSHAITCDKPNGNSSLLIDAAPGIGARKMRYGIRNARVNANSPVYRVLRACNVPMDPENGQTAETATRWVAHFPYKAPEGAIVAKEQTAIAQLEYWKLCKLNWTEHNPSVTIEYSPDEMIEIVGWLWDNRAIVGGLSFLPKSNTIYRQLPYEETTREEYERLAAAFPRIDWSLIAAFEAHDQTTSAQELACGAGGCDVDFAALAASVAKLEAAGL